eukprot:13685262-Alexandrium_andersonii.AAC.1
METFPDPPFDFNIIDSPEHEEEVSAAFPNLHFDRNIGFWQGGGAVADECTPEVAKATRSRVKAT